MLLPFSLLPVAKPKCCDYNVEGGAGTRHTRILVSVISVRLIVDAAAAAAAAVAAALAAAAAAAAYAAPNAVAAVAY